MTFAKSSMLDDLSNSLGQEVLPHRNYGHTFRTMEQAMWHYKMVDLNELGRENAESELNLYGEQGFELTAVWNGIAVLKAQRGLVGERSPDLPGFEPLGRLINGKYSLGKGEVDRS